MKRKTLHCREVRISIFAAEFCNGSNFSCYLSIEKTEAILDGL